MPKLVYHYCSFESFKEIIKNKCIWLCSLSTSNDLKETTHIFEEIVKKKKLSYYENYLKKYPLIKAIKDMYTTISFSGLKDSLPLWTRYSDNCRGCSIGFDKGEFSEYNKNIYDVINNNLTFSEVNYAPEKVAENIISKAQNQLTDGIVQEDLGKILIDSFYCAPMVKSKDWKYEKEHRLLLGLWQDQTKNYISNKEKVEEIEKTKFYRKHAIAYEYNFNPLNIKEIIIGPDSQVTEEEIKHILKVARYKDVNIEKSKIFEHSIF